MTSLPPMVQQVVQAYVHAVDEEAPGFLEGLYLVGSAALDDFRVHTSDIDFVAVTSRQVNATTASALDRVHMRVRRAYPRPHFDGVYVTWQDLAGNPLAPGGGPQAYGGKFYRNRKSECNPVTWHTLAAHGIACRGPLPANVAIRTDTSELKCWVLRNFDDYWRPLLARTRHPSDPWCLISFTSYGVAWIALGVCRLHYTLATGRIASKHAAGRYGLEAFDGRWHRVLNEALRIRESDRAAADTGSAIAEIVRDLGIVRSGSSLYRTPAGRRADLRAFAGMVIDDALCRLTATREPLAAPDYGRFTR